jgi:hypothetical protein
MPLQITAFPAIQSSVQSVTLGTLRVGIGLVWNRALQGWYLDVFAADGSRLIVGRRLCPSFAPNFGMAFEVTELQGLFVVDGTDGYTQGALGSQLQLRWYSPEELQAVANAVALANPEPALIVEIVS